MDHVPAQGAKNKAVELCCSISSAHERGGGPHLICAQSLESIEVKSLLGYCALKHVGLIRERCGVPPQGGVAHLREHSEDDGGVPARQISRSQRKADPGMMRLEDEVHTRPSNCSSLATVEPYRMWVERGGQSRCINAVSLSPSEPRRAEADGGMWARLVSYIGSFIWVLRSGRSQAATSVICAEGDRRWQHHRITPPTSTTPISDSA